MLRVAVITLSLFASAAISEAFAQETDALCGGLEKAIAGASDDRPFLNLVPPGQQLGTLPPLRSNPAGFGDFFPCALYRAGNMVDGVIGGGPYNYFKCTRSRTDSGALPDGFATVDGYALATAERVNVCLAPQGWRASAPETRNDYEDTVKTWRFTPPSGDTEVLVEMLTDAPSRGSRSTIQRWSASLIVRTPNPRHPKS